MGQKIDSNGRRIGVNIGWNDCYCCNRFNLRDILGNVYKIKWFLKKEFGIKNDISGKSTFGFINNISVAIDASGNIRTCIECSEPRMIIGKDGSNIDALIKKLEKKFKKNVIINVISLVDNKFLTVGYLGNLIAEEILSPNSKESCRKIMKKYASLAMTSGAVGIKIIASGRLNGVEIARDEKVIFGTVPNGDIKANIVYVHTRALTQCGVVGISIWLHVFNNVCKNKEESSFLYNKLLNYARSNRNKRNN